MLPPISPARLFVERWTGHGNERSDTSKFWNELLEEVLGVDKAFKLFRYEERVKLDHASFMMYSFLRPMC